MWKLAIQNKMAHVLTFTLQINDIYSLTSESQLMYSGRFSAFTTFVIEHLLNPFIFSVNQCHPSAIRYFGINENSDEEQNEMQEDSNHDVTDALKQKKYEVAIKLLCGKENVSGNLDIIMGLFDSIQTSIQNN
jgi:hypothetical protein